jgi:pentapeptide MXKDX repeat protein
MKNTVLFFAVIVMSLFATNTFAQDSMAKKDMMKKEMSKDHMMKKGVEARTIQLEQTTGKFSIQGLTLEAGTYVFEIANNGVGHDVGFVLAPKSNPDQHIKTAYVQEAVKDGKTSTSKEVTLAKGEYVYFCPLNPTPQYTITVK